MILLIEKLSKVITLKYLHLVLKRNENFRNAFDKRKSNLSENDKIEITLSDRDNEAINKCVNVLKHTNYNSNNSVQRLATK